MNNLLKHFIIGLISLWLCSAVAYAKNYDATGVINAYKQWCAAIDTAKGDYKKIVKFYAPHALLLPTLSDQLLFNDNGELDTYFTELTSYKNIHCTTKRLISEVFGDDFATNIGFYDFTYTDKNGKDVVIPARFTFIYQKRNGEWEIIQHHSSVLPSKSHLDT